MEIRLTIDTKGFRAGMEELARQVPYAASLALNATAYQARDSVRADLGEYFTLRNRRTALGIKIEKSDKRSLTAAVGSVDAYMRLQVEGGEKTPKDGRLVAVPIVGGARPQITTPTTPSRWPGALLRKPRHKLESGRKAKLLVREVGPKTKPTWRLMYILVPRVRVRPRLPLHELVREVVKVRWTENAAAALKKALATAKRTTR